MEPTTPFSSDNYIAQIEALQAGFDFYRKDMYLTSYCSILTTMETALLQTDSSITMDALSMAINNLQWASHMSRGEGWLQYNGETKPIIFDLVKAKLQEFCLECLDIDADRETFFVGLKHRREEANKLSNDHKRTRTSHPEGSKEKELYEHGEHIARGDSVDDVTVSLTLVVQAADFMADSMDLQKALQRLIFKDSSDKYSDLSDCVKNGWGKDSKTWKQWCSVGQDALNFGWKKEQKGMLEQMTQHIKDCKEQLSLMQSVHNLKVKDKPDLPLAASPLPAKSETLTALKKAIKDLEEFKTKLQKASGEKAFQALTAPKKSGDKSEIKSCTKQFTDIAGEIVTNNAEVCSEIMESYNDKRYKLKQDVPCAKQADADLTNSQAHTQSSTLETDRIKAVKAKHIQFMKHLKKCAAESWAQPSLKSREMMTPDKPEESESIELMTLQAIKDYHVDMKKLKLSAKSFALTSTLSFQEFDLTAEDVNKMLGISPVTIASNGQRIRVARDPVAPKAMLQELQHRQATSRSSFKRLFNKLCAAISCFLVSARCLVGLSTKDSKHRNAVIGSESRAVLLSRKADYFTQTPEARKAAEEAAKAAKTKKK